MSNISNPRGEMSMANRGGHLYIMQTNEIRNAIHYHWEPSGTLTEVERVPMGGAGSGTFRPISGEHSAPNALEGADSVILSPARRFLFATNRGEKSVSSFAVDKDGRLTLDRAGSDGAATLQVRTRHSEVTDEGDCGDG
jgi:6-phosphogluconolactonase (cycloisomerase 2 family)